MAVLAFLSGIAFWPAGMLLQDPCQPQSDLAGMPRDSLVFPALIVLALVALVLGGVAGIRITRSQGRLKGRLLAQLAVLLGFFTWVALLYPWNLEHDRITSKVELALRDLHQVEEQYRVRYPDVGYSRDLRSLGPPEAGAPPSAQRAGLVNAELAEGRYCVGKVPVTYGPRAAADGRITGYTIQAEWPLGNIERIDDTGRIDVFLRKDLEEKKPAQ